MSISSQLLILNETKNNIKTAINLKGVTVTDEAFADYPDKVRQIPSGGGTYKSTIILYLEGKLRNAVIPDGTTSIGTGAFYDLGNGDNQLETVTVPSSVTSVGKFAFFNEKNLTEITLPSGLTFIGEGAFAGCNNLTSITILATVPPTLEATGISTGNNDTKVYVPAESVLAYQTADAWQYYAQMITPIP